MSCHTAQTALAPPNYHCAAMVETNRKRQMAAPQAPPVIGPMAAPQALKAGLETSMEAQVAGPMGSVRRMGVYSS